MPERWSKPSVLLHWLAAAMLVAMAVVGFVMGDFARDSAARLFLSRAHALGGAAIMLVTVARLVVRLRGPAPAPLPLAPLHRRGVGVVHALMYVVTFAIGATGVVTALAGGWSGYLQGDVGTAPRMREVATKEPHEALVFVLGALVLAHVGGAVLQQFKHGGTLRRMVPFLK